MDTECRGTRSVATEAEHKSASMRKQLFTGGDFMQILIIEDEKRLADALGQIMQEARYQADIV